jgi:hypothetical protein
LEITAAFQHPVNIGAAHTPVVRWGQEKINRFIDATRLP